MRHGEYIALGKIEAILKTCAAVSNIVVYGSGTFIIKNFFRTGHTTRPVHRTPDQRDLHHSFLNTPTYV